MCAYACLQLKLLNHRLAQSTRRVAELEAEVAEYEDRRKASMSVAVGGGGGRGGGDALRNSEDRFMREEKSKDALELARRQKLELEVCGRY